jgi:hypothetical protein
MDILLETWYRCGHETRRLGPTTVGAAHQGGCAFEAGSLLSDCGPHGSVLHKFVGALDASRPAQGQTRFATPAHAGAAGEDESQGDATIDWPVKERRAGGGLSHRDVDAPTRGRTNPPTLEDRLSSGARVENSDRSGLELSEARTPGRSTQPQENSRVAAAPVAAYKKKPGDCAPIWFSLTRADFCSSRRYSALGRRWAKRRCCDTATADSGFRLLED